MLFEAWTRAPELMGDPIPVLPDVEDRMCRARSLDNPLRRRLAPAYRELDVLHVGPAMTVADLGAGVGYLAPETLGRIGPRGFLYLIDIDQENLEIARRRLGEPPNVRYLVGSAAQVDRIPSESVDRALLSLVLCCLVDKEGAMDEAWRVLRPGGQLLATYPRSGLTPFRRKRSLRVRPERWSTLIGRRPWKELPMARGWLITRHLLQKPGPEASGSVGRESDVPRAVPTRPTVSL